jgi:hypothetical protein
MTTRVASRILAASALLALTTGCSSSRTVQVALPSWNDGPAKQAIVDFVTKTTTAGSPDFVPPEERIAVFDNDGTLWAEQPLYFQFLFALDRVKVLAPQHPEWKAQEPFASLLEGDVKGALAGGEHAMVEIVMATHAGMSTVVHHDDAEREFAYGATSKIGTFSDALMAEADQRHWTVLSMKRDWKTVFAAGRQ